MSVFELHVNLEKKPFIIDLPLCRVVLENNSDYPWIMLIPRRVSLSKIIDLEWEDQIQLLKELKQAQEIILELFNPRQINVAAIGNKTSQLHIHVIARFEKDPSWPQTVWDYPVSSVYSEEEKIKMIQRLSDAFKKNEFKNI